MGKIMSFNLPEDVADDLAAYSKAAGISRSRIVAMAVREYMENPDAKTCLRVYKEIVKAIREERVKA